MRGRTLLARPTDGRVPTGHENKLASGHFTEYQADVYAARARYWVHKPLYGNYDDWDTLLLAPASFCERYAVEAKKFGSFVSHEEVARFVPLFGVSQ